MVKFTSNCKQEYAEYLKGKYFGMLKDFEKGKDFDYLLDSLLIELNGLLNEYDGFSLNKLYYKTASLKYLKYKYFRQIIINDCMPLVDSIFKEEG